MTLHSRIQTALETAAAAPVSVPQRAAQQGIACLDLTTLESTDTDATIRTLTQEAHEQRVAAVCVFPNFVQTARLAIPESSTKIATVAMAFPHGQSPLAIRRLEVEQAVLDGADEIDIVIRRGLVLSEDWRTLAYELKVARDACGDRALKVILETGELREPERIYRAARLALEQGADFVKTSTGKCSVGATPEAAAAMLLAIKDDGQERGIKISGGVRSFEDFLVYYQLVATQLGEDALAPGRFRVGASSLLQALRHIAAP